MDALKLHVPVVKESNKSRFDSCSVRNTVLPFRIVACTFFPTTFHEIAVYKPYFYIVICIVNCTEKPSSGSVNKGRIVLHFDAFRCVAVP